MSRFETIVSRTPIERGWSEDRKYRAVTEDGKSCFLRISPMERYEERRLQFSHIEQVRELGVRVCAPVEFGICPEGCYQLLGWVAGRDAEEVLPELKGWERYDLGVEAGRMLKAIHSLPLPMETEPWGIRFERKLNAKLAAYEKSPLKFEKGALYVELLNRERYLAAERPTVWHHGDFHCGNLMLDENRNLWVIDFDRDDMGDPWYEFNRIIWDVRAGKEFARGLVDGYFDGAVPEEFWHVLRLYLCQNMIASLPWAAAYGEQEIRAAQENGAMVLQWYGDLREIVPSWYQK